MYINIFISECNVAEQCKKRECVYIRKGKKKLKKKRIDVNVKLSHFASLLYVPLGYTFSLEASAHTNIKISHCNKTTSTHTHILFWDHFLYFLMIFHCLDNDSVGSV